RRAVERHEKFLCAHERSFLRCVTAANTPSGGFRKRAAHPPGWEPDCPRGRGRWLTTGRYSTRSQEPQTQRRSGHMFKVEKVTDENGQIYIQDPPIARFLFQSTMASWLWLIVRVYVGYEFLEAGWHKFTDPAWMNG